MELCTIAMAMAMGFDDSTRARHGHGLCLRLAATGYCTRCTAPADVICSRRDTHKALHHGIGTWLAQANAVCAAVCAAVTCALHSLVLARCPVAQPPPHCRAAAREPCPVCRCRALRGPWTCARIVAPRRVIRADSSLFLPLAIAPAHPAMKAGPVGVASRLQQCAMCAVRRRIPLPARRPVTSVPRRSVHGAAVAPTWRPSSALDE
jgi:hypothetical protein